MGGPGRPRTLRGGPKANALADFLNDLGSREGLKTETFAQRFPDGGAKTKWAQYLNGSAVIPRHVLGQVVKALCGTDARLLEQRMLRANQLHKEAAAEIVRPSAPSGEAQIAAREFIALQQRLVETSDKLGKAQQVAARAQAMITPLMLMYARAEGAVHEFTARLERARSGERVETQARLDKARLRLERTEQELELAKQHRYSAEQAQQALLTEAREARQELEELQRKAAGLGLDLEEMSEGVEELLPARPQDVDPGDDEDFTGFDDVLERMTSEGQEREQDLADIIEHTHTSAPGQRGDGPRVIVGTVVAPGSSPSQDSSRPAPEPESKESAGSEAQAQELHAEELSAKDADNPVAVGGGQPSVLLPSPRSEEDLGLYQPEDLLDDLHDLVEHTVKAGSLSLSADMLLLHRGPAGIEVDMVDGHETLSEANIYAVVHACGADKYVEQWRTACRAALANRHRAALALQLSEATETPEPELSRTTPDNPSNSENSTEEGLAASQMKEPSAYLTGYRFVCDLQNLISDKGLSFAKLQELAPNDEQLRRILNGQFPSQRFTLNIVEYLALQDPLAEGKPSAAFWSEEWNKVSRQRRAGREDVTAPTHPPRASDRTSPTAWFWMWVCFVLAPAQSYTVTATFTAGLQASPGAGIRNLVVYAIVGLAVAVIVWFLLLFPALGGNGTEAMSISTGILGILGLFAGLILPWVADLPSEPWHLIADRVGLI